MVDAIFIAAFYRLIFKDLDITTASIYLLITSKGNTPEQCLRTVKS